MYVYQLDRGTGAIQLEQAWPALHHLKSGTVQLVKRKAMYIYIHDPSCLNYEDWISGTSLGCDLR